MNQVEIDFASSKSREDQKRQHVQKFKVFLGENSKDTNFHNFNKEDLNYWLRRFYFALRRKDGKPYKPASLICIRSAISNYLTDAPNSLNIDIINDPAFQSANKMLKALVGLWLNHGSDKIEQYPAISETDQV